MTVLTPGRLIEQARTSLKGYMGRSVTQLALSKLPGYERFAAGETQCVPLEEAHALLALRDLSDPARGAHAMQQLLDASVHALTTGWGIPQHTRRTSALVDLQDNYIRLGFNRSAVLRDQRYSLRLSDDLMLRTHLSAAAPELLRSLAPIERADYDHLFVLPGLAYRRDVVDRFHSAALHQADYWRLAQGQRFDRYDLAELIERLMAAILPGVTWRSTPATHPYTRVGRQVDVLFEGEWLEIGECGVISDRLLRDNGLDPKRWSCISFGLGLDRALMVRKGLPDIRLLRAESQAVQAQLLDLNPWQPVPVMASVAREITIELAAETDEDLLGDHLRHVLGAHHAHLQHATLLERGPGANRGSERLRIELHFQGLERPLDMAEIDGFCTLLTR